MVDMEAPVHLVVDMSLFGCELQCLFLLFLFGLQGCQKAKKINVLVARASSNVRASGYTFEKWHEGACRISHVVAMSASSELKAK